MTIRPSDLTISTNEGDRHLCSGAEATRAYSTAIAASEQDTDCYLSFRKSSIGQPGNAYEVTASLHWTAEFTFQPNIPQPAGLPGGTDVTETRAVPAAEVQTVVEDAG